MKLFIAVHTNTRLGYDVPTDVDILQMCERVFQWGFRGVDIDDLDYDWADGVMRPLVFKIVGVYANKIFLDNMTYRCLVLPDPLERAWRNQSHFNPKYEDRHLFMVWDTFVQCIQLFCVTSNFRFVRSFAPLSGIQKRIRSSLVRDARGLAPTEVVPLESVSADVGGLLAECDRDRILAGFKFDPSVVSEDYLRDHPEFRIHVYMACITGIATAGIQREVPDDISDTGLVSLVKELFGGRVEPVSGMDVLSVGPILVDPCEYAYLASDFCGSIAYDFFKGGKGSANGYLGGYPFARMVWYSTGDAGFHVVRLNNLYSLTSRMIAQKDLVGDPTLTVWGRSHGIGKYSLTCTCVEAPGAVSAVKRYAGMGRYPTVALDLGRTAFLNVCIADDVIVFGDVDGCYCRSNCILVGQKANVHFLSFSDAKPYRFWRINDVVVFEAGKVHDKVM